MDYFDREEQRLEDAYARGELTDAEIRQEIRELRREYQAMVEEEVQKAADDRRRDFY